MISIIFFHYILWYYTKHCDQYLNKNRLRSDPRMSVNVQDVIVFRERTDPVLFTPIIVFACYQIKLEFIQIF